MTLLAKGIGKIDVIAKGARKSGSRLSGASEPLVRSVLTWAVGRHRRFVTVARPVTSYPAVRKDYDRLSAALAWSEVIIQALPYEAEDDQAFLLTCDVMESLGRHDDPVVVLAWGLASLLHQEGHAPDWTECVHCHTPVRQNPALVSYAAGGTVCGMCSLSHADATEVSVEVLIALKKLPTLAEPPGKVVGAASCLKTLTGVWSSVLERDLPACRSIVREL